MVILITILSGAATILILLRYEMVNFQVISGGRLKKYMVKKHANQESAKYILITNSHYFDNFGKAPFRGK